MKNKIAGALLTAGVNVLMLSFAVFFTMLAAMVYYPFLAAYMDSLGISDLERGVFFSLISVAQTFVVIPAGLLADKIDRKWLIIISGLGLALISYAYTYAQIPSQFYVLAIFQGAFNALIPPAAYALLIDETTQETRGTVMSVYFTITNVGMILAPTVGGIVSATAETLATQFIWSTVFFVAGSLTALLIRKSGTGFRVTRVALPKRQLLGDNRFLSISVAMCLLAVANGTLTPVLAVFALNELAMEQAMYGMLFSAFFIVYLITQAIIGTLSDKFGRISVVVTTLLAYGFCVTLAGFSINPWMLLVCYLPVAVGAAAYSPVFYSIMGDIIPEERRGLASGTLSGFYSAGMIVGPIAGGLIQGYYGNRLPFIFAGLFVLVTVLFTTLSFRIEKENEKVDNLSVST